MPPDDSVRWIVIVWKETDERPRGTRFIQSATSARNAALFVMRDSRIVEPGDIIDVFSEASEHRHQAVLNLNNMGG